MRLTVLLGKYPPAESERRREAVRGCAAPGTELEFIELDASFYTEKGGAVTAALAAPMVCREAVEAEARGSNAVVVFGSLDAGVEAASHLVDIPIIGSGRAGYNVAAMIGRRIASLVYTDTSVPYARSLVRSFGLEGKVVSIRSLGIPLTQIVDKAESGDLFDAMVRQGTLAAVDDAAEVLFPQGVSMVPVHCPARRLSEAIGIPVVDGLASAVKIAELHVEVGVTNSRVAYPRFTMPSGYPITSPAQ